VIAYAQNHQDNCSRPMVLACILNAISPGDRTRYADLFRRIQAAITDRRELADGYVFRLNGDSVSLPDLAQWISFERLCCPFFTFQLQITGEESDYWLTLRGAGGHKTDNRAGVRRRSCEQNDAQCSMTTTTTVTITCPECGHAASETMPTDRCVFFYRCLGCGVMLKPKPGDCCVFCSYADRRCPLRQG
jgi:hypothetical protein